MTQRSEQVLEKIVEEGREPRSVIEDTIREDEEETVTCPDCETDFPKDTKYCPSCEEKKDMNRVTESMDSLGPVPGYKVAEFQDELLRHLDRRTDQVEFADFDYRGSQRVRLDGKPTLVYEINVDGSTEQKPGMPEITYWLCLQTDTDEMNGQVRVRAKREDYQNGMVVTEPTTKYSVDILDFGDRFSRSVIQSAIDEINVDYFQNMT